jgi:uncharacterized protein (TIGR04222 family)
MNPFDLRGPEFLAFYLILGALVFTLLVFSRQLIDSADAVKADLSDPYLIAFLRGGTNELVRVATISLVHRKLLQVEGTKISVTSPGVAGSVRFPIEQKLLLCFANAGEAVSAFSDSGCIFAAESYIPPLEKLGLLPDDALRARRSKILGLALAVLLGVALIKIAVAFSRGHTNVGFLIVLAAVFTFVAYRIVCPRLTASGRALLDHLRFLFGPLSNRPSNDLTENDIALLAAVFGITAVPQDIFPYASALYPKAAASVSSSCGTGCGSTGGGGGCGGGGGGCGGGGCGGCGG